ncbi:TerB family tellurite resistance protein [Maribacter hydrothermalis]|uniref:Tellurite resistance protein TerB n=1 Tax=Maribacter hydrothermalis TaxID=1836467 RepID=A0A1B7ZD32_9FLAO|nr:TerB family tellurite resistance protein [Maribacter hydrothermalis]APQ18791.1 hypothetical protein BTR34_16360 [Maribacter hydrothermalis]OBR41035.1 hypothetical protein A9200_14535 [Maribacter hydrothermalis]
MGFQELFESFDKKKRKSHFKNLLAVAMADGKLDNIEFDYIMQLADKCYMTGDEVKRVIDFPEAISFHPPKTERERFDQMYDLVTVMLVDGRIDDREMQLCKVFAMKLGFKPAIVDKLVLDLIDNALKGVAKDVALAHVFSK